MGIFSRNFGKLHSQIPKSRSQIFYLKNLHHRLSCFTYTFFYSFFFFNHIWFTFYLFRILLCHFFFLRRRFRPLTFFPITYRCCGILFIYFGLLIPLIMYNLGSFFSFHLFIHDLLLFSQCHLLLFVTFYDLSVIHRFCCLFYGCLCRAGNLSLSRLRLRGESLQSICLDVGFDTVLFKLSSERFDLHFELLNHQHHFLW